MINKEGLSGAEELTSFLTDKKAIILEKWFDLMAQTFMPQAIKFVTTKKNPFTNPVGHNFSKGIETIYDFLLQKKSLDETEKTIEETIKFVALQVTQPSKAVSYISFLKQIIYQQLIDETRANLLYDQLLSLFSKIDELTFRAFDYFMASRERLYDIKANEVKSRTFRLLQQANLITNAKDFEDEFLSPQTCIQ